MGETLTSQITFSKLLSHTFPGIFLAIGVFMVIHLVLTHNGFNGELFTGIFEDWKQFVAALGGIIFLGTIVGVIIDSIHHVIEVHIIDKTDAGKVIKDEEDKVFKDNNGGIVTNFYFIGFLPLERFQYLIDNYYSYVECELNLSISLFFSAFIYSGFLLIHGCSLKYVLLIFFPLIILSHFCYWVGKKNYLTFKEKRIDFIKGAKENQNILLNQTN